MVTAAVSSAFGTNQVIMRKRNLVRSEALEAIRACLNSPRVLAATCGNMKKPAGKAPWIEE